MHKHITASIILLVIVLVGFVAMLILVKGAPTSTAIIPTSNEHIQSQTPTLAQAQIKGKEYHSLNNELSVILSDEYVASPVSQFKNDEANNLIFAATSSKTLFTVRFGPDVPQDMSEEQILDIVSQSFTNNLNQTISSNEVIMWNTPQKKKLGYNNLVYREGVRQRNVSNSQVREHLRQYVIINKQKAYFIDFVSPATNTTSSVESDQIVSSIKFK